MALKIQLHALLETRFTEQGMQHADHFGALVIHGDRVKVIHFNDFFWTNWVRHGAGIFGKLMGTHHLHRINTVQSARAQVTAKFLIAKYR